MQAALPAANVSVAERAPASDTECSTAGEPQQGRFNWLQQWWPIGVISYLDTARPHKRTLLGQQYVLWYEESSSTWRLFDNRCPHRLAPLSEGRLVQGQLMCSYHGWRFDGSGACTDIPQIGDAKAKATACATARACARAFPTAVKAGLLFAWLDNSPEGLLKAAASQPEIQQEALDSPFGWFMNELPTDAAFVWEQGVDPTHANYLHHTAGFPMERAMPFKAEAIKADDVSTFGGFTWTHGAYDQKYVGMQCTRQFVPPHNIRGVYSEGPVSFLTTYATPIAPGRTLVFGKIGLRIRSKVQQQDGKPQQDSSKALQQQQAPPLVRLFSKLPHWLFLNRDLLAEQDAVIQHQQQVLMAANGQSSLNYALLSRADVGIEALHRWLAQADYAGMWAQRMGLSLGRAAGAAATGDEASRGNGVDGSASMPEACTDVFKFVPKQPATVEQLCDRWQRHTRHCKTCQQGLVLVTRIVSGLQAAAAALAFLSVGLVARAPGGLGTWGAAAAALLAAGCFLASRRLEEFKEYTFISSLHAWRKAGGLSLVPGPPIKMPGMPV